VKLNFSLLAKHSYQRPVISEHYILEENGIKSQDGNIELKFDDPEELDTFRKVFFDRDFSFIDQMEEILDLMATNGMIREEASALGKSWVDVCHDLFHEMNSEMASQNQNDNFVRKIVEARASIPEIIEWLKRSFYYTRSAFTHISGVVENKLLIADEKKFWEEFRADEMHHWKIYSKLFEFLKVDLEGLKNSANHPAVEDYVNYLHATGQESMYQYAALLYMMEKIPDAEELADDPLYGPLLTHYHFPEETILPLWNHTNYNGENAHNDIWFNILRSRAVYSGDEVQRILERAREHCRLCYVWNRC